MGGKDIELGVACYVVVEAYKHDLEFRNAFNASVDTALADVANEKVNLPMRCFAEYIAQRIMGIDDERELS